jgi:hypothetical protein
MENQGFILEIFDFLLHPNSKIAKNAEEPNFFTKKFFFSLYRVFFGILYFKSIPYDF